MKPFALVLIVVFATLIFSGRLESKNNDFAEFKAQVVALGAWAAAQNKELPETAAASGAFIAEMSEKMKAIKTDKLPADLKQAWLRMVGAMGKMSDATAVMLDASKMKELAANPELKKQFQANLEAIEKELMDSNTNLAEVSKRYGLDGLEKFPGF